MVTCKPFHCSDSDEMTSDQKAGKSEKDMHGSRENVVRQAIVKDSFQNLSTASEYPRQWSQSFPALEQQATNKLSKGQKVDGPDRKDWPIEYYNGVSSFASQTNGIKESVHSLRGSGISVKGAKNSSENMQSFKIPEAVVAFAQAAAKTNGEPEKYFHGWPLLSPLQMHKCDKCSREFCSFINYRRHIRVHRRSLNIDKDSAKNRDFLGAFWDKLSLDEAKEIVSFKDVTLEEVPGSSIMKALTSFNARKLGVSSLPHVYVKAAAALLDIIQSRPPRFPISSQEFFSILDDASEKTFLCAGTALSVQKFVFDGDAGKIGLEMKNLVACTSFLVEQKLVKAWIADKDAEALRCQKLLVEEEEAAQKRQAELMEKKRLKKLRQKEQRAKEQIDASKADMNEDSYTPDSGSSAEKSNLPSESSADVLYNSVQLPPVPIQLLDAIAEVGVLSHLKPGDCGMDIICGNDDLVNSQNIDAQAQLQHRERQRKMTVARRSSPKLSRNTPNGFHPVQTPSLKLVAVQTHNFRDQRSTSLSNGHKVWTRKTKLGGEEEGSNVRGLIETGDQLDQSSCSAVLIGSICVMLGDGGSPSQDFSAADHSAADHQNLRHNSSQVKHVKSDASQNAGERSMVKLWRPVGQHDYGGHVMVQGNKGEDRVDVISGNAVDLSSERPVVSIFSSDDSSGGCKDSLTMAVGGASGDLQIFSGCVASAKAFLEQRWKGALAAGYILSSQYENEPPGCSENNDGKDVATVPSSSEGCMHRASGSTQNQLAGAVAGSSAGTVNSSTPKFRAKAEKGSRLKYVPKQRSHS